MIRKTSNSNSRSRGNGSPDGDPATVADRCFQAMVRHSQKTEPATSAVPSTPDIAHENDREAAADAVDLAWGAEEVAVAMFGPPSANRVENRRRRRRVFCMYAEYKKALREAINNKRPHPTNPGWVILPRCARVILSKTAYRAFVAAQLEGKR